MKFAPFSERTQMILLSPIIVPVVAFGVVVFGPLIPFVWAFSKFEQWREKRLEARGWRRWFAWRPVLLRGHYFDRPDKYVWLETIDRKRHGRWSYRFPDELDRWERREAATIARATGQ